MKSRTLQAVGIFCAVSNGALAGEEKLETPQQKSSYVIGLEIVQNLFRKDFNIDKKAFSLGIKDALDNHASRLSVDETKVAKEWQQGEFAKQRQAKAEKNLAASKVFLEGNKTKDGVKMLASGLQYRVLSEGKGARPKATDVVTVNYRGILIDGSEFASTASKGKPALLPISKLIKGWREALLLMAEGAKWQIVIPPALAYGEEGSFNGKIGPNETLVFDMELVAVSRLPGK
jgi:FKBP-type peptidyl-prolyl cis-trans isomerase